MTPIETPEIRVINGALDETPLRGGSIILRGVIHPESLQHLRVDDYQRERKPVSALASIWTAMKIGESLPDIELGMRGQHFKQVKDGTIYLQDPVFIIDGLQRQTTALRFMEEVGGDVRIGAVVHFATDKAWERERFRILNTTQGKVSGNILLRNLRETNAAVLTLYGLCFNQSKFPLFKRVCWSQSFGRHELIGALVLAKVGLQLHRHHTFRGSPGGRVEQIAKAVEIVGNEIGLGRFRGNIEELFSVIDEAWPIRQIDTSSPTPFLRSGFLTALAKVLSSHKDFWRDDDRNLFIEADLRRKIGKFPVFDPNITHLTSQSNNVAVSVLARHLVDHINSGKRNKRLTPRAAVVNDEPSEGSEQVA